MGKNNTTVDRIQAVWNKLGGEEGIDRLLRGELKLVDSRLEFIDKTRSGLPVKFPVWRTIEVGRYQNVTYYQKHINSYRPPSTDLSYRVTNDCWRILESNGLRTPPRKTTMRLVLVSPQDLGFRGSVGYLDLCARGLEHGLELCPPEVSLAIVMEAWQLKEYRLVFATEVLIAEAVQIRGGLTPRRELFLRLRRDFHGSQMMELGVDGNIHQPFDPYTRNIIFAYPQS